MLGPVLGYSVQDRHGQTEKVEQKVAEMIKGLEHFWYKDMVRAGTVHPEEGKALKRSYRCI